MLDYHAELKSFGKSHRGTVHGLCKSKAKATRALHNAAPDFRNVEVRRPLRVFQGGCVAVQSLYIRLKTTSQRGCSWMWAIHVRQNSGKFVAGIR